MVHISMGRDQRLAMRKRKIQFANQIDDLFDDFFVTDINHHPLITIENQIDITAQHMPQLVIDLDNIGKDWFAFEHVNKTRVDDRRGGKPKN